MGEGEGTLLSLSSQNEFYELSKRANECDRSRENNSYSSNFQQQQKIIFLTRYPYYRDVCQYCCGLIYKVLGIKSKKLSGNC